MKFFFLTVAAMYLAAVSLVAVAAPATAPDIQLPTIDGEMNLKELQGKVVYLDFWASWCVPCRASFPWMAKIKRKYGAKGLEIVAVNLDKDRALADAFLKDMEINFLVAFDGSGESAESYGLRGMPGSYLIGRDGSIQASHLGFREEDKSKLESVIKVLLLQK